LLEQSASRLGAAFAGTTAAADDAATLDFNPAGLARLERAEAIVAASGVGITSEFRNGGFEPALLQPPGGDGGDGST
jgi:long-chain fatty acid transport protein